MRRADTEARTTGKLSDRPWPAELDGNEKGTLRKGAFTKSHPTGSQWDFPGCVMGGPGTTRIFFGERTRTGHVILPGTKERCKWYFHISHEIKTSAHSRHRNTTIPTISMPSTPKSLHCWYLLVILIAGVLRSVFGPVVPHGNRDFDNRPFISYSGIAFEPHAGDACDAPWTR